METLMDKGLWDLKLGEFSGVRFQRVPHQDEDRVMDLWFIKVARVDLIVVGDGIKEKGPAMLFLSLTHTLTLTPRAQSHPLPLVRHTVLLNQEPGTISRTDREGDLSLMDETAVIDNRREESGGKPRTG